MVFCRFYLFGVYEGLEGGVAAASFISGDPLDPLKSNLLALT